MHCKCLSHAKGGRFSNRGEGLSCPCHNPRHRTSLVTLTAEGRAGSAITFSGQVTSVLQITTLPSAPGSLQLVYSQRCDHQQQPLTARHRKHQEWNKKKNLILSRFGGNQHYYCFLHLLHFCLAYRYCQRITNCSSVRHSICCNLHILQLWKRPFLNTMLPERLCRAGSTLKYDSVGPKARRPR